MKNLSSYCALVVAKIRASDKDLPVPNTPECDGLTAYVIRQVTAPYKEKRRKKFGSAMFRIDIHLIKLGLDIHIEELSRTTY